MEYGIISFHRQVEMILSFLIFDPVYLFDDEKREELH
jgi:hypothetical protein